MFEASITQRLPSISYLFQTRDNSVIMITTGHSTKFAISLGGGFSTCDGWIKFATNRPSMSRLIKHQRSGTKLLYRNAITALNSAFCNCALPHCAKTATTFFAHSSPYLSTRMPAIYDKHGCIEFNLESDKHLHETKWYTAEREKTARFCNQKVSSMVSQVFRTNELGKEATQCLNKWQEMFSQCLINFQKFGPAADSAWRARIRIQ